MDGVERYDRREQRGAGLAALESRAVRAAFLEAVAAATTRSRELGGN